MIFNALKKKALKKIVNQSQLTPWNAGEERKIETVGIVLEKGETAALEKIQKSLHKLGIKPENIQVLIYKANSAVNNGKVSSFKLSDFNNSGNTDKKEIRNFIDRQYDLLISYYTKEVAPLLWVTTQTKARLKAGISTVKAKVNHFSLEISVMDAEQYINNLIQYIGNLKNK